MGFKIHGNEMVIERNETFFYKNMYEIVRILLSYL